MDVKPLSELLTCLAVSVWIKGKDAIKICCRFGLSDNSSGSGENGGNNENVENAEEERRQLEEETGCMISVT